MVLEHLLYFAHDTPKPSQLISDHKDHLKILNLLAISILHLVLGPKHLESRRNVCRLPAQRVVCLHNSTLPNSQGRHSVMFGHGLFINLQ